MVILNCILIISYYNFIHTYKYADINKNYKNFNKNDLTIVQNEFWPNRLLCQIQIVFEQNLNI
jgi:hypothetical protein